MRNNATFALQSGLAAGVAWLVAHDLVGHSQPFFAPIAAVIVLSASAGLRWRRALELIGGVALGIALGDGLIVVLGVGVLQIIAVVTLAILIVVFLGGSNLAVGQAASSAVLVVALAPRHGQLNLDRFTDAIVGGLVGLLVMSIVLPQNPLSRARRAAGGALDQLAEAISLTAEALRSRDPRRARRALTDLRAGEPRHQNFVDTLTLGREAALLSPLHWRQRPALDRYFNTAVHVERATRNARVMARRSASVVASAEPVPTQLPESLDALALAVRTLRDELAAQREPRSTRKRAAQAARIAGEAYVAGVGFSGGVVVAQVRGTVVDLLRATGLSEDRADRLVDSTGPTDVVRAG
jgi:uncharacterized membrane protein YgaE (UPF0421/DUF939 family)